MVGVQRTDARKPGCSSTHGWPVQGKYQHFLVVDHTSQHLYGINETPHVGEFLDHIALRPGGFLSACSPHVGAG